MALSPNQLKSPHRPISARNSVSYLERSFGSPLERAEEVSTWWDQGVVEGLFDRAKRKPADRYLATAFLRSAARGLMALPAEQRISAWKRLMAVSGPDWALGESSGWMQQWGKDTSLLLWGLDQGYNPFEDRRGYSSSPAWRQVTQRVTEGHGSAEDVAFVSQSMTVERLSSQSPETLIELFDFLCWRSGQHSQELIAECAHNVLLAGVPRQAAFDCWGNRAKEENLSWLQGFFPMPEPLVMRSEAMVALMALPSGLSAAQRLWSAGIHAFPSYQYRSMSDGKTVISSPWFDLLGERKSHDSARALAWSNAVFAAIDNGDIPPPPTTLLAAQIPYVTKELPAGWDQLPGLAWKEWLARIPGWAAENTNVGYAWSNVLGRLLEKKTSWDQKTEVLRQVLPGIPGSPWLALVPLAHDSSVQSLWSSQVATHPQETKALAQAFPGVLGPLSWGALVHQKGVRNVDFWYLEPIQVLLTIAKGTASLLKADTLVQALSKGSAKLVHVLLEDGAPPCNAATLWDTLKRNSEAWQPAAIGQLIPIWQEFNPGSPVWSSDADVQKMWALLYRHPTTPIALVQDLLEKGAGIPSLDQLWGAAKGDGPAFIRSVARAHEMGEALPAVEPTLGTAFKPRF